MRCIINLLLLLLHACSLVADKLRKQDITAAGDALSSALFVATAFGLLIQAVLLVCSIIPPPPPPPLLLNIA